MEYQYCILFGCFFILIDFVENYQIEEKIIDFPSQLSN
jgi:hypothetical protein